MRLDYNKQTFDLVSHYWRDEMEEIHFLHDNLELFYETNNKLLASLIAVSKAMFIGYAI